MDIALGHTPGGVAEQGGDRQFGKAEIAGDASKRMAQRVRRDVFDLGGDAEPSKAALRRCVVAITDIRREDIRTILARRLAGRELSR